MVEYTGELLSESITQLSLGANNITSVLEDVHFLAKTVKSHTVDARDYLLIMDGPEVKDDTETQAGLWQMTLASLVDNLESSAEETEKLRIKLEETTDRIVAIKIKISTMVSTAGAKVNAHLSGL